MPADVLVRRIFSFALVGLSAVCAAGGGGMAWAAAPTRAEVEARLEKAPRGLSPSEVTELGGAVGGPLMQIADDKAVTSPIRLRAVAALAFVRTPVAHDFLEAFIVRKRPSSDPLDRALLGKAAVALGWQSGPRAVEILAPLLDHADADVRLDAVVALGLTRARRAGKPLADRLAVEPDAAVKSQIQAQLKVLNASNDGSTP